MDTDFQNLLNRFKEFPVVERKPSFLDIARFPHRETVWRNIFAFFFDPKGCHGFKDLFLRSFFDAIGKKDQGSGDFDSMTVETECPTEKGNLLDLLIQCPEFTIGIEMKVNAGLYNDLADYGKLVEEKSLNGLPYKVVLSNASCQPDAGFINLLYADLLPVIQTNLGDYILSADPKYTSFLLDFLNHVATYIGGYAMTIDPKQLQFLKDNHETVKRLISTHNTLKDLLKERMDQIHEAVLALESMKGIIVQNWGLFSCQGRHLIKFLITSKAIRFYYEMDITDDYCNSAYFWIDPQQREHKHFNDDLKAAGFTTIKFDLSQPVEEAVSTIEKTILSIVDYLNKKQTAETVL